MTIQEAIKSGKKFKRMSDKLWITVNSAGTIHTVGCAYAAQITSHALLADDWQVLICEKHGETTSFAKCTKYCLSCVAEESYKFDGVDEVIYIDEPEDLDISDTLSFSAFLVSQTNGQYVHISNIGLDEEASPNKCECGSDSVNGGGHSDWCKKWQSS